MLMQEQLIEDIKQLPEPALRVISAVVKEFLAIKNSQEEARQKNSRAAMFGCLRGQYKIARDFDSPLEDFKEYME
ncbi:MAG: DUF2281 domain-containing protein [Clostridiales bacterium]|jgi:hypothetical protein|nr:DUF2281 domain-containing protein [Clostridiales bacterium]